MQEKPLKRKYADVKKVKEITENTYINKYFDNKDFKGNISLVKILEASREWVVDIGTDEERCILGKDLKWLEIYPDNENYCITAIYGKNNEIVEWYIDIADSLGTENGVPYEDDLYLDVVILPNKKVILLDEDELEDAYKNKLITKKQYDLSYDTAKEIMEQGIERIDELTSFCDKYLKILES